MISTDEPGIAAHNHFVSLDIHVPSFYRKTMFFFDKPGFSLVILSYVGLFYFVLNIVINRVVWNT